eukprot:CAMPEP_0204379482 /NCGR_PEP_ID=MMETSP0469-20131031/52642_1 /ASSEMBLY_ACC=CAM_ASM_000384 /TAXON_ID=2969 /ORGANISM="Oxyrrhis marina" /LENGTH=142 /DNA_ID=CAMNT_0051370977 /DNA_START=32 /DNA_END=456 /DNA_ORIENTATION=-
MVSPDDYSGLIATAELGRLYPLTTGYGAALSDVMRIERFSAGATAGEFVRTTTGEFVFEVFVAGSTAASRVRVLRYPIGADSAGVDAVALDGTANSVVWAGDGRWTVTVDRVNADFLLVEDVDDCAASPCHPQAVCTDPYGG